MIGIVAPFDQTTLLFEQFSAVKVAESGLQFGKPEIDEGNCSSDRIIIALLFTLVPHALEQLAVYVPAVFTTITAPVKPLLQMVLVEKHPVATKVASSPRQITVLLELITGVCELVESVIFTKELGLSIPLTVQTAE
jgi:hypothetical protein